MRPHGPCTLAKSEVGCSFTESIDLLGWEDHVDLNVSCVENESLSSGVDKRVPLIVGVGERERLLFDLQTICVHLRVRTKFFLWNKVVGNRVSATGRVIVGQRQESVVVAGFSKTERDFLNEFVIGTTSKSFSLDGICDIGGAVCVVAVEYQISAVLEDILCAFDIPFFGLKFKETRNLIIFPINTLNIVRIFLIYIWPRW